jgi:hypothetical protein
MTDGTLNWIYSPPAALETRRKLRKRERFPPLAGKPRFSEAHAAFRLKNPAVQANGVPFDLAMGVPVGRKPFLSGLKT